MEEISLYKKMYLMRAAEDAIVRYYGEDEMKTPMHMSMGEEAIVAGVCHALTDADYAFGTYRSHALYLGKVGETDRFFAELYGKRTGTAKGKGGSMHLSCPSKGLLMCSAIVGGTISIACGAALAAQMSGSDRVTAVFFGDGATDSGTFWESINYASLESLPILFVHEDNNLAVHTEKHRRHGHFGVESVLEQFKIKVLVENSNDPVRVYKRALEGIAVIKNQKKPVFLSAKYFRYLEHVGVNTDFHESYRNNAGEDWEIKDPVMQHRYRLLASSVIDEFSLNVIEREINLRIEESIAKAKAEYFSSPAALYDDVLR